MFEHITIRHPTRSQGGSLRHSSIAGRGASACVPSRRPDAGAGSIVQTRTQYYESRTANPKSNVSRDPRSTRRLSESNLGQTAPSLLTISKIVDVPNISAINYDNSNTPSGRGELRGAPPGGCEAGPAPGLEVSRDPHLRGKHKIQTVITTQR